MKRTKITLILIIIAIMIFSCGKSNAELKNEFINLTKDKIFLRGYDRDNKKHIIYTFDENGNIIMIVLKVAMNFISIIKDKWHILIIL